ncbi:hypothetical protein BJX61DRAFT_542333 [Aspergillus egyptiacus]|nr:hypothetical protein BJX61DRAFT_542333 [Aspergillus egyptiacus]
MANIDKDPLPNGSESIIPLAHMPQQTHVWQADDDWSGIVDRKERRKLQNRQNQRKWRERRKAARLTPGSDSVSASGSSTDSSTKKESEDPPCARAPPDAAVLLREFEAAARRSYLLGSPRVEHLIGLQRLNVHRAINENIRAIGMDADWMSSDDSVSIFNLSTLNAPLVSGTNIPESLRPTEIQKMVPHHPWLDFFPFPIMRDYLITASHLFDDEELCHDLMAFWDTRNTGATLVVWGQPWDPWNWEVTEGFARKWGWLLRGSWELLVSTNYWRRRRGEETLVWREVLSFK